MIYRILKWDPTIHRLTKTEINKAMVQIFKEKKSAKDALNGMMRLLQRFERMAFNIRLKERRAQQYKLMFVDQAIDKIVLIIRADIQELQDFINTHIENPSLSATVFYSWLNDTAISAIKHRKKWLHYLSMNGTLNAASTRQSMKITEWLLQSNMGFSHADYKKYTEEEKQKKVRIETSRILEKMAHQQQISRYPNRNNTYHYNQNGFNNSHNNKWGNHNRNYGPRGPRPFRQQGPYQQSIRSAQGIPYNQMMQELNTILAANGSRLKFFDKKNYCAFWNHHATRCSKQPCDRKHLCMNCDGDHQLRNCPHFRKDDKKKDRKPLPQ